MELLAVGRRLQLARLVHADGEQLHSSLIQVVFDSGQRLQMPVAEGTPAAAIENQHGRLFGNQLAQADFLVVLRTERHVGNRIADFERRGVGLR